MDFVAEAQDIAPEIIALRHHLHQHPEIGLELPWTQQQILDSLNGLPLDITLGRTLSSITAVLRGGTPSTQPAPAVLIRADMDGLPVTESTGLEYSSQDSATMHACGHDAHMAMTIGALRILVAHRDELPGDVVFMFQPGEEGFDGCTQMITEGVLEASGTRVSAAYALHVFARDVPAGTFMIRPGAIMSASDTVRVTVRGHGGHGSAPHATKDPIVAAAAMVTSLQTMVAREFDAFDPVVVSVGRICGGTIENVIPDQVELLITVRTFSQANRSRMQQSLPRHLKGIAAAHDVEVDVDYHLLYPVTRNDPDEAAFAAQTVRDLFGEQHLLAATTPMSASEDFSFVLQEVPGVFIPLGAAPDGVDPATAPSNHSPNAVFDDSVLAHGSALLAAMAAGRLAQLSELSQSSQRMQKEHA